MPKNNEARYKVVKLFIERSHIKIFAEIFDQVPKSIIAKELHTNTNRITRLMKDPLDFKLKELNKIATLFKVELPAIIKLVTNQETKRVTSKNIACKTPTGKPSGSGLPQSS